MMKKLLSKIGLIKKTYTVRRRFPNSFSGFEETEHLITNRKELEEISWVDHLLKLKGHHALAISKAESDYEEGRHKLMHLSHYDEKYGGCKVYFVVGYIMGEPVDKLGLKDWYEYKGDHLDGCPQKKWQHDECECGYKG